MSVSLTERTYPKKKRQEVFEALVALQDQGMSLHESRNVICKRFALSQHELMDIEREGIREDWPPLTCDA